VIYRQIFESPLNDARILGITASQITTLAKAADQVIARLKK
jgi:hypothetical protein